MTTLPHALVIHERDFVRLDGAELAGLARLRQRHVHERWPDDPPTPLDHLKRQITERSDFVEPRSWLAMLGDEVVGTGRLERYTNATNPGWREASITVHPDHRRQGIGRELFRRLVEACTADEIVIALFTNDRIPAGAEFARRVGATEGLTNRTSELRLADIDRQLVAAWAALSPGGYRLEWIDGAVPDHLITNVIAAYDTMNTAPRGELEFGEWRMTEGEVREWDRLLAEAGSERRLLLAIHEATGATAGFTEIERNPATPWAVGQHGTAVVPEHRGHGIGKWLKALMVERILRDWPDARAIRTGNAYSNVPMLSINDRLGFVVRNSTIIWQVRMPEARAYAGT